MSAHAERGFVPEPTPRDDVLSERDLRILEFEQRWWRHAGAKEAAIRSEFALTAARYYQVLNALIDTPAAVRHDPMLVARLRRARDVRTQARSARTFTRPGSGGESVRPRSEESTE